MPSSARKGVHRRRHPVAPARIYLVGFMAAGKTSVGRELARGLGWPFVDLDEEVVRRTGRSIREIFERFGEAAFRRLELEALFDTARLRAGVVATGGGTFASPAGRTWIARHGRSVWLDLPFEVLAKRSALGGGAERPLFADPARALQLYRRRRELYRTADLCLTLSGGESPAQVAERATPALLRLAVL